jgi:hypothetical protein
MWFRLLPRHKPPPPRVQWNQAATIAVATVAAAAAVSIPSIALWVAINLYDSQQQDRRELKAIDLVMQQLSQFHSRLTRLETFHEQMRRWETPPPRP